MSCDIAIWHSKRRLTDTEANEIYHALVEGDTTDVEPHPSIQALLDGLRRRYPDIDTLAEIYPSGAHVLLCLPWSRAEEIIEVVVSLTTKHALICFDPQDSVILTQT